MNRTLILLLMAVVLGGCATGPSMTEDAGFERRFSDFEYCAVPMVRQGTQKSCGMAALTSLLQYWNEDGAYVSERLLMRRYPPESKQGYPMAQLKEVAVKEGLLAFAVTLDRDPMEQLAGHLKKGRPVLLAAEVPNGRYFGPDLPLVETLDRRVVTGLGPVMKHHYVVAMGMSDREILLMDPQYGYVRTGSAEFEQFWKAMGHAALITSVMPAGVKTVGS